MDSSMNFNSVYGPAAGQAASSTASPNVMPTLANSISGFPSGVVGLVILGLFAWWVLESWD